MEQVLESKAKFKNKTFWLFFGAQYQSNVFWEPKTLNLENLNYVKVLSREKEGFEGFKGYVQDALLSRNIDLTDAQVYACGSNNMIQSAKKLLIENELNTDHFFSDAFVQTN